MLVFDCLVKMVLALWRCT